MAQELNYIGSLSSAVYSLRDNVDILNNAVHSDNEAGKVVLQNKNGARIVVGDKNTELKFIDSTGKPWTISTTSS